MLHSLRYTCGTRLGKGGAGAFSIARLMGRSSVTISQWHVHPAPEALEKAVEGLEALNREGMNRLPEGGKLERWESNPGTIPAPSAKPVSVSY